MSWTIIYFCSPSCAALQSHQQLPERWTMSVHSKHVIVPRRRWLHQLSQATLLLSTRAWMARSLHHSGLAGVSFLCPLRGRGQLSVPMLEGRLSKPWLWVLQSQKIWDVWSFSFTVRLSTIFQNKKLYNFLFLNKHVYSQWRVNPLRAIHTWIRRTRRIRLHRKGWFSICQVWQ